MAFKQDFGPSVTLETPATFDVDHRAYSGHLTAKIARGLLYRPVAERGCIALKFH